MACARDPAKGAAAVAELVAGGIGAAQIQFRRVDIDDQVRTSWAVVRCRHSQIILITIDAHPLECTTPGFPAMKNLSRERGEAF